MTWGPGCHRSSERRQLLHSRENAAEIWRKRRTLQNVENTWKLINVFYLFRYFPEQNTFHSFFNLILFSWQLEFDYLSLLDFLLFAFSLRYAIFLSNFIMSMKSNVFIFSYNLFLCFFFTQTHLMIWNGVELSLRLNYGKWGLRGTNSSWTLFKGIAKNINNYLYVVCLAF